METLTQDQPSPEAQSQPDRLAQVEAIKCQVFDQPTDLAEIDDPWADGEFDFVAQSVEALTEQTLQKIEQQLGAGGSGWYEQKFTGDRFHLQFYDNPDQARTEFIANSIYRHLEIKAPETELVTIDGRVGLATAEVPGTQIANPGEQRLSADVRAGFVADAYLANTNVIGNNYENVIIGVGGLYRSSAAGALIFDAAGGAKDFDADQIPELETMLDPGFTSGQIFAQTFDSEIANQTRLVVSRLDPETIDAIVADSGLAEPEAGTIRDGLVGRLRFLANRLAGQAEPGANRDCRLGRTIDNLDGQETRLLADSGESLRACEVFLSDGDRIEAQTVNLIDCRADRGCLELRFKLTPQHRQATIKKVVDENYGQWRLGGIHYQSAGYDRSVTGICDAVELQWGGLSVRLAIDNQTKEEITHDFDYDSYLEPVRSAAGLVSIEIPCSETEVYPRLRAAADRLNQGLDSGLDIAEPDFAQIENQINRVLVDLLGIPGGLTEPDAAAENQHKIDRWAWHHKLEADRLDPRQLAAAENLQRLEVAPGCWAMVEAQKHWEYQQKYGRFAFFHQLLRPENLIPILAAGGLMSAHRRFSLGVQSEGMSTDADFKTGGADSVFTRLIVDSDNRPERSLKDARLRHGEECYLVLDPALADRTDYYAYPLDAYGSTRDDIFKNRQSPERMFDLQLKQGYFGDNEQMFADGIASQMFQKAVFVHRPEHRRQVTEALMAKILPDVDQRRAVFDQGPEAVQSRLEQAFGLTDPVNSLWQAGPQALADFFARHGIDEIEHYNRRFKDGAPVRRWPVPVDEWLQFNRRLRLIKNLEAAGIDQVNGQPLAEFVTEAGSHYDFVDLARGQMPQSQPDWPSSYQKIPELYGQPAPGDSDNDQNPTNSESAAGQEEFNQALDVIIAKVANKIKAAKAKAPKTPGSSGESAIIQNQ